MQNNTLPTKFEKINMTTSSLVTCKRLPEEDKGKMREDNGGSVQHTVE